MIDQAIDELAPMVGRPRATHYRWHPKSPSPPKPDRVPASQPRALDEVERKEVLRVFHGPEHVDEAPASVYAKLLDNGIYLASPSTMYRILRRKERCRSVVARPPTHRRRSRSW